MLMLTWRFPYTPNTTSIGIKRLWLTILRCARGWWSKAERQVGHEEGLARWSKSTTQGSQAVLRGAGKGAEPPELAEVLMKFICTFWYSLPCDSCDVLTVSFRTNAVLKSTGYSWFIGLEETHGFLNTQGVTRYGCNFVRLIKTGVAFPKNNED